jgi:hypothetical protein
MGQHSAEKETEPGEEGCDDDEEAGCRGAIAV